MACSSGCPTPGAHRSYGECMRSKGLQVAGVEAHAVNQNTNRELNEYVRAREAGLQPDGTRKHQVDAAWKLTDALGTPYRADA